MTARDPGMKSLQLIVLAAAVCLSGTMLRSAQIGRFAKTGTGMAVSQPGTMPHAEESKGPQDDELLLRGVGVSTDGEGLLAFFRERQAGGESPQKVEKRVAELIARLGGKDLAAAQAACGQLAALGGPAIPLLRQAARDADAPQGAELARRCLDLLENRPGRLSTAAVRLLGQRRPAGAAAALLAFVPLAEDEDVLENVRASLGTLTRPQGKVDPALLAALRDPVALRRAVAVDALCQQGSAEPHAELSALLKDPVPAVRLRAALALARARDADAVHLLIDLLARLTLAQAREAEEVLIDLAGEQAPGTVLTDEASSQRACHDAWQSWWKKMDDRQLLTEVRSRTLTEDKRRRAEALIARLADDEFEVREQAQKGLIDMGVMILPLLNKALSHPELEVRRRLRRCIQALARDSSLPLPVVVPRLLAIRKPPEAVEVLLAYIPFADREELRHETQIALNALALRDGRLNPALVRGLEDPLPVRRGAAAEAICLSAGPDRHLPALRSLLDDPDPGVRLQTALALAGSGRREAVAVVLELLGKMPREQQGPAIEYLERLAQDRPPRDLPRGDLTHGEEEQRQFQEAWKQWWADEGKHVALVPRYPVEISSPRGNTLVVYNNNQVVELDRQGKERWSIKGLLGPMDAQMIGSHRVLVAEHQGQRVTERNLRGDILWQHQMPGCWPVQVERLPNRNTTLIVCRNRIVEVDRTGREVLSIPRPQNDVASARKMRNGEIVAILNHQAYVRLNAAGQEIKRIHIQMNPQGAIILPSGNVLVPIPWINKIQEYDAEGKKVWEADAFQAGTVSRTGNGNTLVCPQQPPMRILELDRQGAKVAELPLSAHAIRMHRR